MNIAQLITTLHHLHQQYVFMPFIVFIVALLIVVASVSNPRTQTRYLGYGVAVVLIVCFAFVI